MSEDIAGRIERLSPEARALFWETWQRGAETEFAVPPEELLVSDELACLAELPREDQAEFFGVVGAIVSQCQEEGYRLLAESIRFRGFAELID